MGTITRLKDLHLHRLQLFTYCSIGQSLLQKFLIEETLKCGLSTKTDPFEALSDIFGYKKDLSAYMTFSLDANLAIFS